MEEEKKLAEVNEVVESAPVAASVEKAPENKIKGGKYTDYTEHDLLTELVKLEKKTARRTGIVAVSMAAIALVFVVSAVIVVPQVMSTLTAAETTLENANDLMSGVNDSLDGMNKMISNVDTVLTDNTAAMEEAITKIGSIDVEGLNESIDDLNKAVEKMSKLFGA